jgi:deferrochelatase/peroxidase EfeB
MLELDDIQGLVLRGYRKNLAAHLVLRIDDPDAFRRLLAPLTDEASPPYITAADDWEPKLPEDEVPAGKPKSCLNIAFTRRGLEKLGVDTTAFPEAFLQGADERAEKKAGETGPDHPDNWTEQELIGPEAHAILSVYADTEDELEKVIGMTGFSEAEIRRFKAHRLDERDVEHFGYVDGISQPTIEGAPPSLPRDPLPPVKAGEFVLGHRNERNDGPQLEPSDVRYNGSFAAFRVMYQDVPGFLGFLEAESRRLGVDKELLAAKVCGRWRNGEPLVMRPVGAPAKTVPDENLNDFDYEATAAFPESDREGLRCPRGAHIRRAFPRSQRVIDDFNGLKRRIVRRAMPYGDPYDPATEDGEHVDRGLVGMFICASLEDQYEYVMRNWINGGLFAGGLGGAKDPLIGANDPAESRFEPPGTPRVEVSGFPAFVITRGCAYVFLPSMNGLRHLAREPARIRAAS